MKTLEDLNKRAWYRLTKVIYLFFLLLITILVFFTAIKDQEPEKVLDYKKSYVLCDNGTGYILGDVVSKLTYDSVYVSIYDTNFAKLDSLCYSNDNLGQGARTEPAQQHFTIEPKYKREGSYLPLILWSILTLAIIVIANEIIRRVFYYIVLGTFRPKKHAD